LSSSRHNHLCTFRTIILKQAFPFGHHMSRVLSRATGARPFTTLLLCRIKTKTFFEPLDTQPSIDKHWSVNVHNDTWQLHTYVYNRPPPAPRCIFPAAWAVFAPLMSQSRSGHTGVAARLPPGLFSASRMRSPPSPCPQTTDPGAGVAVGLPHGL